MFANRFLSFFLRADVVVWVLAAVAFCASWFVDEPEAYTFPRLVSILFLIFATANLIRSFFAESFSIDQFTRLRPLLPGMALIALYIALAEHIGFYVSAALIYWSLAFAYSENHNHRSALKSAVIALAVVAVLYLLFAILLKVQTPRGFLI